MKYHFSLTLPSCGSCVSHSHCKDCCNAVVEDLLTLSHIEDATLDPAHKVLVVESSLDPDSLEDLLDEKGVFVMGTSFRPFGANDVPSV